MQQELTSCETNPWVVSLRSRSGTCSVVALTWVYGICRTAAGTKCQLTYCICRVIVYQPIMNPYFKIILRILTKHISCHAI